MTIQMAQIEAPPGVIDFGIGHPSDSLLPLAVMREAAAHRLNQDDALLLQYGVGAGDGHFRQVLAQFLTEGYGMPVEADHLFVTGGASQGLDLICTLFTQPDDIVFVEEPTYFLALRIFADHHLNIVSVPIDEEGLIIEALEEKLGEHEPTLLYTISTFHNPSSVTLSAARRKQVVALSKQHKFLVVADEVYHLLNYTVIPPPPPLASYAKAETVLSLGSFSKILAPGLRLGWIQAVPTLLERFALSGLIASGGGLNPFTANLVRSAIELELQQDHLAYLKTTYRQRAAALCAALRQQLPPYVTFTDPQGGFFIWLSLPEEVDTTPLLSKAQQEKVGFQPGIKFSSIQGLQNHIRLCFSYYDVDELEEGVARLVRVFTMSTDDTDKHR